MYHTRLVVLPSGKCVWRCVNKQHHLVLYIILGFVRVCHVQPVHSVATPAHTDKRSCLLHTVSEMETRMILKQTGKYRSNHLTLGARPAQMHGHNYTSLPILTISERSLKVKEWHRVIYKYNPDSMVLRKHAYSNIQKISPPKTEKFQTKNWYFSYFCSKHRLWVLVRTASSRRF